MLPPALLRTQPNCLKNLVVEIELSLLDGLTMALKNQSIFK